MKKLSTIIALLLILSGKALAQFEFEYVFDSIKNETPCALFQEIVELDNGDFILNGRDLAQYTACYCICQFSPTGELIKEKLFINELQLPGYILADDEGPRLLVNRNGGYYLFITYNPIFDTINTNYVPGTFDAKIMMKKLNDDFEIEYSREMSICLDTVDWKNLWGQHVSGCQDPKIVMGTVMDNDDEGFVISYEKYIGEHPTHLWEHGYDSTFFLKTDYDLNVNNVGFYEHNRCNNKKHKNHLLYDSEENKYIYYTASDWSLAGEKRGFYAHIFDDEFNFIEENMLPNSDGTGFYTYYLRDEVSSTAGITFKRTTNNTTILGAGTRIPTVQQSNYHAAVCLELNDKAKMIDSMTFAGGVPITSAHRTAVPVSRSIDWVDESRIFFSATFDAHFSWSYFSPKYQYFTLRMLDRSLNTECEMYYDMGKDSTALWINALRATRDGGCIIAGHYRNYVENPNNNFPRAFHSVVKKFPPEAFEGIEEAHDNGLKVAFAYPNPGNNVLNIRTALQNAHLEVYDINGKLICNQEITDIITTLDTECWPSGTYIWKVVSDGKEAEAGKWVK